jgi:hypothetical protein
MLGAFPFRKALHKEDKGRLHIACGQANIADSPKPKQNQILRPKNGN